jgi:hypothetical protein
MSVSCSLYGSRNLLVLTVRDCLRGRDLQSKQMVSIVVLYIMSEFSC